MAGKRYSAVESYSMNDGGSARRDMIMSGVKRLAEARSIGPMAEESVWADLTGQSSGQSNMSPDLTPGLEKSSSRQGGNTYAPTNGGNTLVPRRDAPLFNESPYAHDQPVLYHQTQRPPMRAPYAGYGYVNSPSYMTAEEAGGRPMWQPRNPSPAVLPDNAYSRRLSDSAGTHRTGWQRPYDDRGVAMPIIDLSGAPSPYARGGQPNRGKQGRDLAYVMRDINDLDGAGDIPWATRLALYDNPSASDQELWEMAQPAQQPEAPKQAAKTGAKKAPVKQDAAPVEADPLKAEYQQFLAQLPRLPVGGPQIRVESRLPDFTPMSNPPKVEDPPRLPVPTNTTSRVIEKKGRVTKDSRGSGKKSEPSAPARPKSGRARANQGANTYFDLGSLLAGDGPQLNRVNNTPVRSVRMLSNQQRGVGPERKFAR